MKKRLPLTVIPACLPAIFIVGSRGDQTVGVRSVAAPMIAGVAAGGEPGPVVTATLPCDALGGSAQVCPGSSKPETHINARTNAILRRGCRGRPLTWLTADEPSPIASSVTSMEAAAV